MTSATPTLIGTQTSTSLTVSVPAGARKGDLLVIMCSKGGGTDSTFSSTDFTELYTSWHNNPNRGYAGYLFLAGDPPASYTLTGSGGTSYRTSLRVFRGVASFGDKATQDNGVGTSTNTAPSVTPDTDGSLLVWLGTGRHGNATANPAGGYGSQIRGYISGIPTDHMMAYRVQPTAAATGSSASTSWEYSSGGDGRQVACQAWFRPGTQPPQNVDLLTIDDGTTTLDFQWDYQAGRYWESGGHEFHWNSSAWVITGGSLAGAFGDGDADTLPTFSDYTPSAGDAITAYNPRVSEAGDYVVFCSAVYDDPVFASNVVSIVIDGVTYTHDRGFFGPSYQFYSDAGTSTYLYWLGSNWIFYDGVGQYDFGETDSTVLPDWSEAGFVSFIGGTDLVTDPLDKCGNVVTGLSGVTYPMNEINVKEGAESIPDGTVTPRDFGSVAVGASAPQKTFTIENTGDATLNITSISVPAGYEIDASSDLDDEVDTIETSTSKTLVVNLVTSTAGTFAGEIVIESDDADEATYSFGVTGEVLAASGGLVFDLVSGLVSDLCRDLA